MVNSSFTSNLATNGLGGSGGTSGGNGRGRGGAIFVHDGAFTQANNAFNGNAASTRERNVAVAGLEITSLTRQGNDMLINWQSPAGWTNIVQSTTGGAGGGIANNFSDLSAPIRVGDSGVTNYMHTGGATNSARYYRIRHGL